MRVLFIHLISQLTLSELAPFRLQIVDCTLQIEITTIYNLQSEIYNEIGGCRGFIGPVPPPLLMSKYLLYAAQYSMYSEALSIRLPPERVPVQHAANLVADLIRPDGLADEAIEAGIFRA